jgi:hypothetical protein
MPMLATHEYANDLILFALIVDCGSFSKAAETACVTSSVVSKHIGRLINLFATSPTGISPPRASITGLHRRE